MNDTTTASTSRTRQEKTKRLFIDSKGEAHPRAGLDSVAGQITFINSGEPPLEFRYADLSPEIQRAAALFGIMTSVTNTVGRADMSLDEMVEAATDRLRSIVEDGKWSAGPQSGPRTSDLIEAARRWYSERNREFTSDMEATMTAKLSDEVSGPEYRANLMKSVAAHFAAIKAERAAERAAKAKDRSAPEVDDLL